MALTSTHEDYIEAVYRRSEKTPEGVRITDLAGDLGCRLPTVTRTVKLLVEEGYFDHEARGLVLLTPRGEAMAREVVHRHDDIVAFLEIVLGLTGEEAAADACRLEHGLSPLAAERLHFFLEYLEDLPNRDRQRLLKAVRHSGGRDKSASFRNLVSVKTPGWRR